VAFGWFVAVGVGAFAGGDGEHPARAMLSVVAAPATHSAHADLRRRAGDRIGGLTLVQRQRRIRGRTRDQHFVTPNG
jgi:hypothetical protein